MFHTGLLILTSSPRILTTNVSAYLKAAKNFVNKTLYIKLEPNQHHLWPVQQPVFTPSELSQLRKLIPDIYFKAAGVCAHLDIRVLQTCFKDPARKENHLKPSFDVVLTDGSHARTDLELYVGHQFNKSCSNFHRLDCKLTVNETNEDNFNGFSHGSNGVQNSSTFQTFDSVCLGGTFDRLHLGHKVLLSEAVLHATGKLVVGVTDGDMLKGKLLWELIEPVEARMCALLDFLHDIDATLHYDVQPIYNPYGPTIEDDNLECLYVSEETMKGGRLVNEERARRGMPPMVIRSVGLAEDVCRCSGEEFKVSSSSLRRRQLGTLLTPPKPRPDLPDKPYLVGLTGGICTGKSHIIKTLESLGAVVINCDPLGHESYRPGTKAYSRIVETFGDKVVSADGTINRKVLGAIIFADEAKRQQLNNIVWPEVSRIIDERLEEHRRKGTEVVVLESALLLEAGWENKFHQVWVCVIPVEEALKRVMARDNLEKDQALRRVQAQMSNKERVNKANVIFCSLWDYATTERQVARAWNELQAFLSKKKSSAL